MNYFLVIRKPIPKEKTLPTFLSCGYTEHNALMKSLNADKQRLNKLSDSILKASCLVYDLQTGYRLFQ